MKRYLISTLVLLSLALTVFAVVEGIRRVKGSLTGYEEIPAVSTVASGNFKAAINEDETEIEYELTYSDLEGSVTQAHVHFGQAGVNGGISFWLCGTASNPGPAGTPTCPSAGTVTRTITAADITGPNGQGIEPGAFGEVVQAIRAGRTYANVHSTKWTGGEIRSQLGPGKSNHPH